MLNFVNRILADNEIRSVFCSKSVYSRIKAIKSFKEHEDVRVILLSLKKSASETNLQQTSHIILIDPPAGSQQEAEDTEVRPLVCFHFRFFFVLLIFRACLSTWTNQDCAYRTVYSKGYCGERSV